MSIKSKVKRDRKKRLFQVVYNKRRHNEYPHRICNWPKCQERSYTFKRCRYHRLKASLYNVLSKGTKQGKFVRVQRGVYGLPEWYKEIDGQMVFTPITQSE